MMMYKIHSRSLRENNIQNKNQQHGITKFDHTMLWICHINILGCKLDSNKCDLCWQVWTRFKWYFEKLLHFEVHLEHSASHCHLIQAFRHKSHLLDWNLQQVVKKRMKFDLAVAIHTVKTSSFHLPPDSASLMQQLWDSPFYHFPLLS